MKKNTIIILAIMFLAACSKENMDINPDTSTSNTLANKVAVTRPFEVNFNSTVDPNPPVPPMLCTGDLPGFALPDHFLHGTATHFGQINSAQSRITHTSCDLSFATALLTVGVSGQIVAANGDLIYYTGNDEIDVYNLLTGSGPTGTITGSWTITGGTGRFDQASGSFTINGFADFTTLTISFTGLGTITY